MISTRVASSTAMVVMLASLVMTFAVANDIKHLQANDAHLVETSQNNFGLTTPLLLQQTGYKTVSINGNQALVFTAQCQQANKMVSALSQQEQSAILAAKQQMYQAAMQYNQMFEGQPVYKSASSVYSLVGQSQSSSSARNIGFSSFNNNGNSITKYDGNSISLSRPGLPGNVARIFIDREVATMVYRDGQVLMKPIGCLTPAETQLVEQIRQEVQVAEQQFQANMGQFNQNMANWQQNLQRNMQNMNQNMQQNMNNMNTNLQSQMQNLNQNLMGMFSGQRMYQAPNYGYQQQQQQQQQPMGSTYGTPFWPGFPF